jgi:5-methylcytosine-specific restriction endonuclease McrA
MRRSKIRKVSRGQANQLKYRAAQCRLAFERDEGYCQVCGRNGNGGKLSVHHVIYLSQGGSDELDNLMTLCQSSGCWAHDRAHNLREPYLKIEWTGVEFVFEEVNHG